MSWYHVLQMTAFALAAWISWRTPRAPKWVMLLCASYVLSVLYVHLTPGGLYWPPTQFVGLLLDGVVLVVIREYHKEKWEWGLLTVLAFMVTADVIQLFGALTGFPPPLSKDNFGVLLECLNYAALVLISGIGLLDWVRADDRFDMAHPRRGLLYRTSRYAHIQVHNPKTLRSW